MDTVKFKADFLKQMHSPQQMQLLFNYLPDIYFFAKDVRDEGALDAVPEGYVVSETKNGLPVLKKAA